MTDIKQLIRSALKGRTKQNPLCMAELLKLGNGADDALDQLQEFGEIDGDMVNGRMAYWTVAINPVSQQPAPSAAKVQPNTANPPQETEMKSTHTKARSGSTPSPINQAIYDKIVEHPGISHAALIKHALEKCPEATEKQVVKTIGNMRHVTKKIRAEGDRDNYTYHLNRDPVQPRQKGKQERAAKPRVGKVVTGKEAAELRGDPKREEPAGRVISDTKAPDLESEQALEKFFSLYLDDLDHLHITIGNEDLMLNPDQTARLHRFMSRVSLGAVA